MLICLHLPVFTLVAPQNSDLESFQCKLTALNSSTLGKLRHILDHRCIVGGGEQIFLLALGVSQQKKGLELVLLYCSSVAFTGHLLIAHNHWTLPCVAMHQGTGMPWCIQVLLAIPVIKAQMATGAV